MIEQQIQQIELNIEQAKHFVQLGESLDRLHKNKDFQFLMLQGYLQSEAVRLVHLKADPNQQTADVQASIVKQMDGIGALLSYFRKIEMQAELAKQAIEDDRETLQELMEEGVIE